MAVEVHSEIGRKGEQGVLLRLEGHIPFERGVMTIDVDGRGANTVDLTVRVACTKYIPCIALSDMVVYI